MSTTFDDMEPHLPERKITVELIGGPYCGTFLANTADPGALFKFQGVHYYSTGLIGVTGIRKYQVVKL